VPARKKTRISPSPVAFEDIRNVDSASVTTKMSHKRTASEAAMAGAVNKLSLVETVVTDTTAVGFDDENTNVAHNLDASMNTANTNELQHQYVTPPPMMKKQKKRIQPIQLIQVSPPIPPPPPTEPMQT
jgi:hypothetical protein